MTVVGISGTRKGLTQFQADALYDRLKLYRPEQLHHGDCVGVDAQAHEIAHKLGILTFVHPPASPKFRAFVQDFDQIYPEMDYLSRNIKIIEASTFVLAFPSSIREQKRGSGTWQVIRECRRARHPLEIIFPSGYTQMQYLHESMA